MGRTRVLILWVVALIALVAAVGGAVWAGSEIGDAATDVLPGVALLFSLVHGSLWVGWRGVGAYFVISYVVAFALEACSVAFGFPFGYYEHFTGGPSLLDIPLVVPSAYFAYGWIAWVLASVIVRGGPSRPVGAERFTVPLVATVILTGWDFTFDAVYATVNSQYRYDDPGGYFGVPVSNFLGWLLTGWVISQVFALVESKVSTETPPAHRALQVLPSVVWALPVLPLLGFLLSPPPGEVTVGDRTFVTADIYGSAFVTGLMTLGFVAALALIRATARPGPAPRPTGRVDESTGNGQAEGARNAYQRADDLGLVDAADATQRAG
ncbi:carotenoid biosynthesis protein [Frankia nepalensis]|uniref:carotenoid biosynthesis protein n=1 Tax=Frankia nepalensis TaxID=1836974 RepID=UPI0027DD823E|nr:carotenoid biosynthesis protein [Frankia nepalensis]